MSYSEHILEEVGIELHRKHINEALFMSKEEKAEQHKRLDDLAYAFDKKYNAFCLSVSGYSIEKLQDTLDKKKSELNDAKSEKKAAKERYDKLAAQVKIDYLNNVCSKLAAMIKKKKSYEKK